MSKKLKKPIRAKALTGGFVVDSSVAIAWCFTDEQDPYSQSVLDAIATGPAYVPGL